MPGFIERITGKKELYINSRVEPDDLWYMPLRTVRCGAGLLIYMCQEDDLWATLYKVEGVKKFPQPSDKTALREFCIEENFALMVANRNGVRTERFADKNLGPFNLALGHTAIR